MAKNQVTVDSTTRSKKGSKKPEATSTKSKAKAKAKKKNKNNTINANNGNKVEDLKLLIQPPSSTSDSQPKEIQHRDDDDQEEVEADSKKNKLSSKKEEKKKKNKKMKEEEEDINNEIALYNFPMNRINRIIKGESDVRITQEALFLINKASEKFLQLFTTESYTCSFLDKKNHIGYQHLSSVVCKRRRFDFLQDFVPEKVKVEDALKEMPSVEM